MTITVRQESPQANIGSASTTTLVSNALSSAALVGSGIEVAFLWNANSTLPTSVIDSAGQHYTYGGLTITDNNDGVWMAIYYLNSNTSATALSVTATFAAAQTFYGPPHIKEISGTSGWQGVTPVGADQLAPGTGVGAISTGNITPTAQPCLASSYSYDDNGNGASSVVAGSLVAGTTDWVGGSSNELTTASQRLTSTSAFASTFTNTTDGGTRRFLSIQSLWTESSSSGAALAATPSTTTSATGTLGLKHVVADLVSETTTTTGTGALSLAGAVTGYRAFSSVMNDQDTCLYLAQAVTGGVPNGPWEIGIGTYNASGNTLSRTQVVKSSNSNALVSFAAGTTNVVLTEPAAVLWNKGVHNVGNSGSAITIDWVNGPYQMVTLNAATPTITLANSMLCPHGELELYQDATGGRVPTITGAVYRSGSAPTWSTTNATHDTLDIHYNMVTGKSNVFLKT